MIKHTTAKLAVSKLRRLKADWVDKRVDIVTSYIDQQESLQAEYEALKKDVARFMTMNEFTRLFTDAERDEYQKLWKKLTKVGNA